jgi:hypothetical protein
MLVVPPLPAKGWSIVVMRVPLDFCALNSACVRDSVGAHKMNQSWNLYQAIEIFNFAIAKRYAVWWQDLILQFVARFKYLR